MTNIYKIARQNHRQPRQYWSGAAKLKTTQRKTLL
jgi:hypothetical protein